MQSRSFGYKEDTKSKTYSAPIKSDLHVEQIKFWESDYFKVKSKERYKIEAKNSKLKHRYGYNIVKSLDLINIEL